MLNQPIRINGLVFTVVGVTPKGFTGTTLGDEPAAYVPLCFKPRLTPNWTGIDRWDDYWLYLFARLKPGVTPARAAAALNGPYGALRGAAVQGAAILLPEAARSFPEVAADPQGRQPRPERHAGRKPDSADHPDDGYRAGAADRHGQRRQSSAGALGAAPKGAGHPRGHGRRARRADGATAHRSPVAGSRRRPGGPLIRCGHAPPADQPRGGERYAHLLLDRATGPAAAAVRAGAFTGYGVVARAIPGVGGGRGFTGCHAQRRIRAIVRDARHGACAQGAGVRPSHDLGGAADSHRAVLEKPGQPAARGPGNPHGERRRLLHLAGAERLPAGREPRAVRARGERNGGHPGGAQRGRGHGAAHRGEPVGEQRDHRWSDARQQPLPLQRARAGILRKDGNSADRGAGVHRGGQPGGAQGGGGQPGVRQAILRGAKCHRPQVRDRGSRIPRSSGW